MLSEQYNNQYFAAAKYFASAICTFWNTHLQLNLDPHWMQHLRRKDWLTAALPTKYLHCQCTHCMKSKPLKPECYWGASAPLFKAVVSLEGHQMFLWSWIPPESLYFLVDPQVVILENPCSPLSPLEGNIRLLSALTDVTVVTNSFAHLPWFDGVGFPN